jgi:hypothetical protein
MIKKITLVAAIVLFAFGVNAQIKFKGIAVGGAIGTQAAITTSGVGTGFGINALGLVGITEKIDVEAGFDYFFPSSVDILGMEMKSTLMTINVNGRYNFTEDKTVFYGLAGLNYGMASATVMGTKVTDSEMGLNIGGGVDLKLSDSFGLYGQVGYTVGGADQVFVHVGLVYFIK